VCPVLPLLKASINKRSGSVISEYYTSTPSLNAAQSTSLASALHSVETSWLDSPAWTSARDAIYSAAPSSVRTSIDSSGYGYKEITSQTWYTKVPKAQQTAIAGQISAVDSVAAKIVGTPSKSSGGAMKTGVPMVVGAMGLMGGVLAAL
jgi:hypothetical protein